MRQNDNQVCLKLAGSLRVAIEADAVERERGISWVIRHILIDHYAQRIVSRATAADASTGAAL